MAWFVFAPSANVAWVYDGGKGLTVLDFRKGVTAALTNAELPGGWADPSLRSPPKEVVDRLPATLRPRDKGRK